jgi:hypothetical protein
VADDAAATAAFPYPPDDPDVVAMIAAAAAAAGSDIAEPARVLHLAAAAPDPGWDSSDGRAALAELAGLGALADEAGDALLTAGGALLGYRRAVLHARAEVRLLRRCYAAALLDGDTATIAGLHSRRRWVDVDLATAASRTAFALRETLGRLGITAPVAITSTTIDRLAVARLPAWATGTAAAEAVQAARRLDPDRRPRLRPEQRAAVMSAYQDRADDPVFATTLLATLGPAGFRALLTSDVPEVYDAREQPTLDRVFGFLGSALAAAGRDPAALPPGWLGGLLEGINRPDQHALRMGLGLALRHGRYGGAALETIVPAMLAADGDHGYSIQQPRDDPVAGALHALSTDGTAARRVLGRPGIVAHLLARAWPDDGGAALGTALAATYAAHDATASRIAETTVAAVGASYRSMPVGVSPGLGRLLGHYIDDVNQGLIDRSIDAGTEIDEAPPRLGAGPHPRFDRIALARALFVTMHAERGTATLFAHQFGYAQALLTAVRDDGRAGPVRPLAKNYGRLSALHQMALTDAARRADIDEQARLRNRTVWLHLAQIAVGMIPGPDVGIVIGAARGFAVSRAADALLSRYYTRPLATHAAARRTESRAIGAAEERASKLLVHRLLEQTAAGSAIGRTLGPAEVSDAFQAGQRDADEYLLPEAAGSGG